MGREQKLAVEGWFTAGDTPALIGSRCGSCGNYAFPKETTFCKNPRCGSTEFDEVPLSTRGKVWSFTNNCYSPPAPYVASDPFEPYAIAAVELEEEQMVVLGQMVPEVAVEDLKAGMEVELTVDTLFSDDDNDYLIWKWRPTA